MGWINPASPEFLYLCLQWMRGQRCPRHPIDISLGIETSNRLPHLLSNFHHPADNHALLYAGAQPSIIRNAIRCIGCGPGAIFFDLGSGKGRALIVAAEFPFDRLVGYELSERLVRRSRSNISKTRLTDRVEIIRADASRPLLPDKGEVVIFLYNPLKGPLVAELISTLETQLKATAGDLKIWIIYYNPVHYELFDRSPMLKRYAAARLDFDDVEKNSSPFGNTFDSYLIYQSAPFRPALASAGANVNITIPDFGAIVETV